MRDPDTCIVKYCGYKEPRTPEELEFEVLGLETAIREAQKRIATLKQSQYLVEVTIRNQEHDYDNSQ